MAVGRVANLSQALPETSAPAPPLAPSKEEESASRPAQLPSVFVAPHPPRPAIDVRGVRHVYKARAEEVHALLPLHLSVYPGELLAILGPSGCGKSTLLRIVAGLLQPTAGTVRLDSRPPAEAHRRHAIGWLAQDDGLFPWRTVADNVALPLSVGTREPSREPGVSASRSLVTRLMNAARRDVPPAPATAARSTVQHLLRDVGLADAARRFPHELSGGMRQRAALARALVNQPSFLLLDEPFAHLDELTRERLGGLLLDLRCATPNPPTTVLVTHSVAEAVRLADRIVVFSDRPGRVLLDLPIHLPRPRRDDQPGFGKHVQRLKALLNGPMPAHNSAEHRPTESDPRTSAPTGTMPEPVAGWVGAPAAK